MNDEFMEAAYDPEEDYACQRVFLDYIDNCWAYVMKAKITNPDTGEKQFPDERLMRKIECYMGIAESGVDDYRRVITAWSGTRNVRWNSSPEMSQAILWVVHEQTAKQDVPGGVC
jgi:predicted Ser/Thr protein kinase